MKKKLFAMLFAFALSASLATCITACGGSSDKTDDDEQNTEQQPPNNSQDGEQQKPDNGQNTEQQTPDSGNGEQEEEDEEPNNTDKANVANLQQLTEDKFYNASFNAFITSQTQTVIKAVTGTYNAENVKGIRWCVGSKSDTELASIKCIFTVADPSVVGKETYYEATVNYASPVALNDIADENTAALAGAIVDAQISATTTLSYNLKNMQSNKDVVNSLLDVVNAPNKISQVMLEVVESQNPATDIYRIGYVAQGKTVITDVEVEKAGNIDTLIDHIYDGNITNTQTTTHSSLQVAQVDYTETKYEISDPQIPDPPTPEFDTAKVYQNLEGIYNQAVGFRVADPQNIYSYKWDLGEFQNDRTQTLKLIIQKHGQVAYTDNILTFNVNLPIALSKEDLQDSTKMSNITLVKANVVREYSYTYTVSEQGNNDALIEAVAKAMNTQLGENFDYANAIKLYTDNGTTTGSGGTQRMYTVVLINNDGIREYNISVSNGTIESMISKINAGNFAGALTKSVDFSENQIENVATAAQYAFNFDFDYDHENLKMF